LEGLLRYVSNSLNIAKPTTVIIQGIMLLLRLQMEQPNLLAKLMKRLKKN